MFYRRRTQELKDVHITEEYLSGLPEWFTELRFKNCSFSNSELFEFLRMKLPKLEKLQFNNILGDTNLIEGLSSFIESSEYLSKLYLKDVFISHEELIILADALSKNTSLRRLSFENCDIKPEGFEFLAGYLGKSKVEYLFLSERIGDKGLKALANALPNSLLRQLSLKNCDATSEGFENLTKVIGESKITHFSIYDTRMECKSIEALANAIEENPHLEDLIFERCIRMVEDKEGLPSLLNAIKKSNVKYLALSENYLGPDEIKSLVGCLEDNRIEEIDLSVNHITKEGAYQLLDCLYNNKTIKCIALDMNSIESSEIEYLKKKYSEHAERFTI